MNAVVSVGKAIRNPGILVARMKVDLHGEKKTRCQNRQSAELVGGMGYALYAVFLCGCGVGSVGIVHSFSVRGC